MKRILYLVIIMVIFIQPGLNTQQEVVAQDASVKEELSQPDLEAAHTEVDSATLMDVVTKVSEPPASVHASENTQASSSDFHRAQNAWLYPDDLDPPETCHVSLVAPLGQDVEHMLAPWDSINPLTALDQPAAWKPDFNITGAETDSDLAVISLNTEELVAAWQDAKDGMIYTSGWDTVSGWSVPQFVGVGSSSGKPALLSRGPVHYAVFARFDNSIKIAEYYLGSIGDWRDLPNIDDAASDPVAISLDAGHMAVFYQKADGTVKFTEWEGAWLSEPISFENPLDGNVNQTIASEISIASRGDTHLGVFAVDIDNQLWYRERMETNQPDWSNTRWIKLMQGVEKATPAVTSRHANHIGVVVKDTSDQPHYLWWSMPQFGAIYLPMVVRSGTATMPLDPPENQSVSTWNAIGIRFYGWHGPVQLGDATFNSPMTLVPRSHKSLSVLGIQSDNILYEMTWSEQEGWGTWSAITPATIEANQNLSTVEPRVNNMMILGRRVGSDQAWSKHYSNQDEAVTESQLSAPTGGYPRAQAVVFAEGRAVWVSVSRDTGTGIWQAKAQEISTGISDVLDLNHEDSGQVTNRVFVASADLEVDGSHEVVVATLQSTRTNIDISVLEITFPGSDMLELSASHTNWQGPEGEDINVAIGDLDPETYQKEIVVGYRGTNAMHIGVYQYSESGLTQPVITGQRAYYWEDWCTQPGQDGDCSVSEHDMEMAIGHVFDRYKGYKFTGDQLVILDLAHMQGRCVIDPGMCAPNFCTDNPADLQCVDYVQDYVDMLYADTDTWTLDPIDNFYNQDPSGVHPTSPNPPAAYSGAVSIGDMNADGGQDVVYAFSDRIVVSQVSYDSIDTVYLDGFPDQERSLVVGDINLDGRAEAGIAHRDIGSTKYELVEVVGGGQMLLTASHMVNGSRTLLVADTDNDTQIAELAGCKVFADFSVVAVVNGVPRWYADGQPIQQSGGYYGRTDSSGGGDLEDGTTETYGPSLTLGYEYEQSVPLTGVKVGGVRASVTGEYMYTTISETVTISSTTQEDGYQFGEYTRGMVVYNSTQHACYYYDVYPPAIPENRTRSMICQPTGRSFFEDFKPLEDWHSMNFKQSAGPSWVDVGHRSPQGVHTNDLDESGNYSAQLPVDESQVMYIWPSDDTKRISYSSLGGFESYWGISQMTGGELEDRTSHAWNVTASAGFFVGGFQLDASFTYGQAYDSARMVTWEKTLEMGGLVEKYQDPTRECYDIVPYVYTARAVTAAGMVYDYLELDYYVPWIGHCVLQAEGSGSSLAGGGLHPE
jgi:hypothetical protein